MKFTVEIDLGNSAFENPRELPRILRKLADDLDQYPEEIFFTEFASGKNLRDIDGNVVGTARRI